MMQLFSEHPVPPPPDAVPILGFENLSEAHLFHQLIEIFSREFRVKFSRWSTPEGDIEGNKRNQDELDLVQKSFTAMKQRYDSVQGKVFGTGQLHRFLTTEEARLTQICRIVEHSVQTYGYSIAYRLFGRTRGGA